MSVEQPADELGFKICQASENSDYDTAQEIILGGVFYLLQEIDLEEGVPAEDENGECAVLLATVEDDETAVICFTDDAAIDPFIEAINEELPEGLEMPILEVDGTTLLEGLPQSCGLLVNPEADSQCYFPPGVFNISSDEEE